MKRDITISISILQKLMGADPAPTHCISSNLFQADRAWSVEGDSESFIAAHPKFWGKVDGALKAAGVTLSFDVLRVIEIDEEIGDTDAMKMARRQVRQRFATALHQHLSRNGVVA